MYEATYRHNVNDHENERKMMINKAEFLYSLSNVHEVDKKITFRSYRRYCCISAITHMNLISHRQPLFCQRWPIRACYSFFSWPALPTVK